MNLKFFIGLFLILGFVFANAAIGISSYTVTPSSIKPGSSGKAVVTITNNGDQTASQTSINYNPSIGGSSSFTQTIFVGDISAKGSTIVTVPFTVSESLAPKIYSLNFDVYFQSIGGGTGISGGSIPVSVTNPPIISFVTENVSNEVIVPSSTFTITALIKNEGGPANNVQITYPQSSTFTPSGSGVILVGRLATGESKSVTLPFRASSSITDGAYAISLNYSFEDSNGASTTSTASFGPILASSAAEELTARIESKNKIQPGAVSEVDVVLTNLQDKTLRNLVVSLGGNSSNYVVLEGNDKLVNSLAGKSEAKLPFKIGINPASFSSFYPVTIVISYVSPLKGGNVITKVVGLQVSGESSFNVLATSTPNPILIDGQTYSISLKISNTGNSPVRALAATVQSSDLEFSNGNSDYVGTLNTDDFSSLTFQANVKPETSSGTKMLNVTITYKDTYNRQYSDSQLVPLQVYTVEEYSNLSGTQSSSLGVIILVVIVALVGWFVVRKFRAKKV